MLSRSIPLLLAAVTFSAGALHQARAQTAQGSPVAPKFETRAELEAQALVADSLHRKSEAWLLRTRLEHGDFQEGDRIVMVMRNNPALTDTLTVRAGKVLQLPQMDPLSLEGVLRSELTDRLTQHVGKYLRDPSLTATPLLRLAVLGHVGRPGFYYVPADALLSDVIMKAGGPSPDGDLSKANVRRGTDVVWPEADVRTALADGLSLDRLHLRAGDELYVGARRRIDWYMILPLVSTGIALTTLLIRR